MSFILRTVDEHLINYHTHLGDTYNVVNRECSPEYFEQCLKRDPFGGDPETAAIHVSYWGGYKYIQTGEHAYIMTGIGETFENLTPPKRRSAAKQKSSEPTEKADTDYFMKNWSKLIQGAGRRITINKKNDLHITAETEFGRMNTSFREILKGMIHRNLCLAFPTYEGKLLIVGYTARLHESEIDGKFSKWIDIQTTADSNGQYYCLKSELPSTSFPVFDENVMSLVGYGLLFDMETVHKIVSTR